MFVSMTVHKAHPGKEALLLEMMHRYGEAGKGQPGLQQLHVLRDTTRGELIGLTLWDNEAAMTAYRNTAQATLQDNGFEALPEPIRAYTFEEA